MEEEPLPRKNFQEVGKSIKNEPVFRNISRWLREPQKKPFERLLSLNSLENSHQMNFFKKKLSSSNSLEKFLSPNSFEELIPLQVVLRKFLDGYGKPNESEPVLQKLFNRIKGTHEGSVIVLGRPHINLLESVLLHWEDLHTNPLKGDVIVLGGSSQSFIW